MTDAQRAMLGLGFGPLSDEAIRAAYKHHVAACHPDTAGGNTAVFLDLRGARDALLGHDVLREVPPALPHVDEIFRRAVVDSAYHPLREPVEKKKRARGRTYLVKRAVGAHLTLARNSVKRARKTRDTCTDPSNRATDAHKEVAKQIVKHAQAGLLLAEALAKL